MKHQLYGIIVLMAGIPVSVPSAGYANGNLETRVQSEFGIGARDLYQAIVPADSKAKAKVSALPTRFGTQSIDVNVASEIRAHRKRCQEFNVDPKKCDSQV